MTSEDQRRLVVYMGAQAKMAEWAMEIRTRDAERARQLLWFEVCCAIAATVSAIILVLLTLNPTRGWLF